MLKSLPAILIFCTIVHISKAQMEKGQKFIGASMDIIIKKDEGNDEFVTGTNGLESERFRIGFYPYIGVFVKDGLAIGAKLDLYLENLSSSSEQTTTDRMEESRFSGEERQIGVSAFIRKMQPIKGRFGFYIQPELGYRFATDSNFNERLDVLDTTNSRRITSWSEGTNHTFNLRVSGGLYFFLSDHFSIETNLLSIDLRNVNYTSNQRQQVIYSDNSNNSASYRDRNSQSWALITNLTNNFSISRVLTINYYF